MSTLPEGFTPLRITSDDLTFDELDRFVEVTGTEIGKAKQTTMLRGLAVLGLAREGIEVTMDDLGSVKLKDVIDMEYLAAQGAAAGDPTVAGA